MPPHRIDRPAVVSTFAGVSAIASIYIYFLIFAEFAFIEHARQTNPEVNLPALMLALGLAGIGGSFAGARWFRSEIGPRNLALGYLSCAAAAGLNLVGGGMPVAVFAALAVGGSLAWSTVTLSLCLRPTLHLKKLGTWCGLGTGLAYAFCNQPLVFTASPTTQIVIAIFAALAGFVVSFRLKGEPAKPSASPDYRPIISALWVVLFLSLVWLDSAAFFIIQHTPVLKNDTWTGPLALQGNALVHLCAAVIAGLALDRRLLPVTIGAALLALMGACLLLGGSERFFPAARVFYTAGVSLYSTGLVYFAARGVRPWLAGILFAVAGWFGSAAGIGMAQSLHAVPYYFVAATALVATATFGVRHLFLKRMPAGRLALGLLAIAGWLPRPAHAQEGPLVALGREIYISEGCIHCHSQYVRPQSADEQRWGPGQNLNERLQEQPPLIGNRRQGPDLASVGNRRSPEWNRLHLIAPRSIVPGSRMPGYAHLFAQGEQRGEALVAYLASLGNQTVAERMQSAPSWLPRSGTLPSSPAAQRALFQKLCAGCHGPEGRGDGPLALKLSIHPPDFSRDAWRHLRGVDPIDELTRIIKFGLPGTPMAGHEYLSDGEVVSLADYVAALHHF
jgi:mono/diheme cytochrome c family protein